MAPPRPLFSSLPGAHTVVPRPRTLGDSLASDGTLANLLARVRASQERLDALAGVLPAPLRTHLRAGPLDDDGWTLLAANAAIAAKLRHLLPTIAEALAAKGWQATAIRVKVQSTQVPSGRPG